MASGHANRANRPEHMAALTNPACVKKVLANSEPSTHGTSRHTAPLYDFGRKRSIADMGSSCAGQLIPFLHQSELTI